MRNGTEGRSVSSLDNYSPGTLMQKKVMQLKVELEKIKTEGAIISRIFAPNDVSTLRREGGSWNADVT